MDKNSLLASLIGDQLIGEDDGAKTIVNTEQDLFGDIAIDESVSGDFVGTLPPETTVTQAQLQYPFHTEARDGPVSITDVKNTSVTPIASPPAPVDSLLSKSGLLGVSNTAGNSGGLFDEVDDECRDIEAKK